MAAVVADPRVARVVEAFLAEADAALPGLVQGLYLVGSVAMDDFRWGSELACRAPSGAACSDIDFIAVTAGTLSTSRMALLRRVHRQVARRHRRPMLDGRYVTWADLANDPAALGGRVAVHGRTVSHRSSPVSPVT